MKTVRALCRLYEVRKLNADAILFGENLCKKRYFKVLAVFSVVFWLESVKICKNNNHTLHVVSLLARSHWQMLNTRPKGLMFKQLPQDLAKVNA